MARSLTECKNCLQQFDSHYPYCPYCGQKSDDQLTLGVLFNNTLSNYFSVDARFFKSFFPLMFKPGYLAKQFVEGRRLLYLHPAQMYLFISIVFFFLFSFISRQQAEIIDNEIKKEIERSHLYQDSVKNRVAIHKDLLAEKDSLVALDDKLKPEDLGEAKTQSSNTPFNINFSETEIDSMITAGASDEAIYKKMGMEADDGFLTKRAYKQALKFLKNKSGGSILHAFYDSVPLAMFILLPIFALILKLFYHKKGRFAHHLVFSFYFFAFLFAILTLIVIGYLIWPNFPIWLMFLMLLSVFFYLFMGVRRFYGQGIGMSFFKTNVISFLFLSIVAPFALVIMGFMAFLFY
ncbi:DUF3667 domain-containing protein [Gelidibacter salicanalis]|uniref:DUF3667 domain-containing protein n=1 Tax=Gelidibacter salicanalis TaxID=291193 RepID=A0A934KMB7_9FLAO|nr:DUF3667 domain-containing protein [Gelidibacter salicanalis]MBJ7879879.1 DUF3667 domain-containing protein [Gelidibacter salicanalis]